MGAIPEAFRSHPGTLRSSHPLVSVCANGRHAQAITAQHALEFCEGAGTPFEKLYELDGWTLLLGVGFNRCTSLPRNGLYVMLQRRKDDERPKFLLTTRLTLYAALLLFTPPALALTLVATALRSGATVHVVAVKKEKTEGNGRD